MTGKIGNAVRWLALHLRVSLLLLPPELDLIPYTNTKHDDTAMRLSWPSSLHSIVRKGLDIVSQALPTKCQPSVCLMEHVISAHVCTLEAVLEHAIVYNLFQNHCLRYNLFH